MIGDTLENVWISQAVVDAWRELANAEAKKLLASGKVQAGDWENIPEECAKANPDGSLRIWVTIPGIASVWMNVPKGHWSWRNRPN